MRALLDTNIIIHRENKRVSNITGSKVKDKYLTVLAK